MINFNVHYLEDANFKAVISDIKGSINHSHWGTFYVRSWHKADKLPERKVRYERKADKVAEGKHQF